MQPPEPSDAPPRRETFRGHAVTLVDEGAGPAVIAIHGVPGSLRDFRWLAPALDGLRIVRFDLPGFGGSPPLAGFEFSPRAFAGLVREMLEAIDVEPAVVLGHSWGGAVAVELATQAPSLVPKLGLISSVGARPHLFRRNFPAAPLSWALRARPLRRVLRKRLRDGYIRAGFPRSLSEDEMIRAVHCIHQLDFRRHATLLGEVRCPTLVAYAIDDRLIEPEIFEGLSTLLPDGPRLALETGGHNIQKTAAIELAGLLGEWLR